MSPIVAAGIPVWIDARALDRARKGYDYRPPGDDHEQLQFLSRFWNSEDVVNSAEVAEAYAAHWQARQAGAVRFGDVSE